ncbi:formylmethanofuran dehydrogenase subunit E [Desulfobaculum xiamenense]|uniref:Formylmethanofuran dehydrogenase subunit E n=1 Tax=Desulfobaculum xiamenense TaxID=995050 RepID=A0A846QE38_9BACT|nr:FmdE family protein [Desulfobaculum xiamenense]NJB66561.1 formylmethanofuran dehydrogenase subunit E [Desulfobaculum xiamenense]
MRSIPTFDDAAAFHGHVCPGLALGYRVALAALERLGNTPADDEEIVCIVENDTCAVDAVQVVTGCTFGKGNLIFLDHGKQAYTFYNRADGRGIRIYADAYYIGDADDTRFLELANAGRPFTGEELQEFRSIRERRVRDILSRAEEDFMTVSLPRELLPRPAQIRTSVVCDGCGERVMDSRITMFDGRAFCLTCLNGLK